MRLLAILIILNLSGIDINKIARINELKKTAEAAYRQGDYDKAIATLSLLTDSMGVAEDPLYLNLANAYFHKNDTANAIKNYARVLDSKNNHIKSVAYQQLGVIKQQQNKMQEALEYFKAALLADPANEDARYDYELLKKLMKEQQNQQQKNQQDKEQDQKKQDQKQDQQQNKQDQKDQQQNKEDQKKDQQQQQKDQQQKQQEQENKEQQKQKQDQQQQADKNKEGEKKDQQQQAKPEDTEEKGEKMNEPPMTRTERLKQLNLTEEKAKMILEAMKNQEIQYIQQQQHKAKKRPDSNKPDW